MKVVTKEMIDSQKVTETGWSQGQIRIACHINGDKKELGAVERMIGVKADDYQWKRFKVAGQNARNKIHPKNKGKSLEAILKPKKKPSKNAKNQGRKKAKRKSLRKATNDAFFSSREWRELRYRVIEKYGARCMACGRNPKDHGIVIHCDHIKPRLKYPKLELVFENLQLLCEDCNLGKSYKFETDWRPKV